MSIINNTGLPWSKVKMADKFLHAWAQEGIPGGDPVAEYVFDRERKWRFDLAWPAEHIRLAIEFDGAGFGHMTHKGRREDMLKRNEAVRQGWRILTYEKGMLTLNKMTDIVSDAIDCLAPPETAVEVEDLLPVGAI